MEIKKRLLFVLLAVFIVIMGGTIGYYLLYEGITSILMGDAADIEKARKMLRLPLTTDPNSRL